MNAQFDHAKARRWRRGLTTAAATCLLMATGTTSANAVYSQPEEQWGSSGDTGVYHTEWNDDGSFEVTGGFDGADCMERDPDDPCDDDSVSHGGPGERIAEGRGDDAVEEAEAEATDVCYGPGWTTLNRRYALAGPNMGITVFTLTYSC